MIFPMTTGTVVARATTANAVEVAFDASAQEAGMAPLSSCWTIWHRLSPFGGSRRRLANWADSGNGMDGDHEFMRSPPTSEITTSNYWRRTTA